MRLPGKVLADVGGEPVLALLLRRLRRSRDIERIVVATSTDPADDRIEQVARGMSCDVHRGSRDDVLSRFAGAATGHAGPLARVTADCPLIDSVIVDAVIDLFCGTAGCAYASNIEPRTYPDGLDVEVFSSEALGVVAAGAVDPQDREHVTPAIRRDPHRFRSASLVCEEEQLGDVRWTVDTHDDLEFVREVVARLGPRRYTAGMREILEAVRREPSLTNYGGRRG
jgi:spore coat polysaccharide biosynthesis protein SpsF (cytidylyltransferase family)